MSDVGVVSRHIQENTTAQPTDDSTSYTSKDDPTVVGENIMACSVEC